MAIAIPEEDAKLEAISIFNKSTKDGLILRAIVLLIMDEINILRVKAGLSQRTASQIKSAIINKINSGDAD